MVEPGEADLVESKPTPQGLGLGSLKAGRARPFVDPIWEFSQNQKLIAPRVAIQVRCTTNSIYAYFIQIKERNSIIFPYTKLSLRYYHPTPVF